MTESTVAQGNSSPSVGAVILAGGRSERFGRDKIVARLAGRPLIDHVLAAVPADWEVVVVGRPRSTARTVRWVLEDPPDGGPLAGVAAGVDTLGSEIVVVIAGDMPWVGRAGSDLVDRLRTAGPDVAAVVARDETGHTNPQLAAYRREDLKAHLPRPAHGRRAKLLLDLPHLAVDVAGNAGRDVDRPEDLPCEE